MLQKPYDPTKLYAALASWLQPVERGNDQPLFSDLKDPDLLPLVEGYIEQVKQNVSGLKSAVDSGDLAAVRIVCQSIKGTGIGYGFPLLSTVAKEVVTALDASMSVGESMREIRRLQAVSGRLRVSA